MDTISLIFVIAILYLVYSLIFSKYHGKKVIPGPTGLPLVGYIPFLTKEPNKVFKKLAEQYGPIYKVRLGSRDVVALCDFKTIKEAYMDDAFMGRPEDLPFYLTATSKKTGAIYGMAWKEQKKFSIHILRDLGFGKTRTEELLKEEILEMLEQLDKDRHNPLHLVKYITPSTSNNIFSFLFGKRLKFDDPQRQTLDKHLRAMDVLQEKVGWQMFFPWIKYFLDFFKLGSNGKLMREFSYIRNLCLAEMKEHEATLDSKNIRDYVDGYLIEIKNKSHDPNSGFQKDVLADLTGIFFGAGSESVRILIEYMSLVSIAFPEVQKKIHQEIDEVLGRDRFPTWQDRLRMPYTEAAILEFMRWKANFPFIMIKKTTRDTELDGYFIPKNSDVFAVLYCPFHDETLWGKDVEEYKPEHFLSEDGSKVIKPEHFIPFSIGRRSCPGKILAEIETFLYFTAILQKYELKMPPGESVNLEPDLGIILPPKIQKVCLIPR